MKNAAAATAAARAAGIPEDAIAAGLSTFAGVPHRLELVREVNGVRFVNDSKATNPEAAERALSAYPPGIRLILGGSRKGIPFKSLAERASAAGVARAYLIGESADEIIRAQLAVGSHDIGLRNGPVPQSFGVVLDGDVVVQHPMAALTRGDARDIAMLFVVTGAEVRDLRGPDEEFTPPTVEAIAAEIASWRVDLPRASAIAARYRSEDLGSWRERVLTDYIYRLPAARAALAQNAAGGTAWLLQLDEPGGRPGGHALRASGAAVRMNLPFFQRHSACSSVSGQQLGTVSAE